MVIPDPSHSVALWTFVAEQRQEWGCIGGDGKQRKKATFWSQLSFSFKWPWNHIHLYTSKKKSRMWALLRCYNIWSEVQMKYPLPSLTSPLPRNLQQHLYNEESGSPVPHVILFIPHVVHIYALLSTSITEDKICATRRSAVTLPCS